MVSTTETTSTGKARLRMTTTREFQFERATKNTYRFQESGDPEGNSVIGVLYAQKHAFDRQPTRLTVTIEAHYD